MTNFFAGIYGANEALTTARYGLDVTGQNIANANTPGYTRQRADQVASGTPVGVSTIHSGRLENGGVRALGASRLGDLVLDTRVRAEHSRSANVDTAAARLADIENIFKEPSDTGLAEQLHDFWNAWGDVANDPGGQVPREMLIASAQSTVTMLRSMNSALDSVETASANSLNAKLTSANTAAKDLSTLNQKIAIGHATGANVNALLDQRDMLLDTLAQSVGAVATIHDNGTASVTVGGQDLVTVDPGGATPFAANTLQSDGAVPSIVIKLADSSGTVLQSGGADIVVPLPESAAGAELGALNTTIPRYRQMLDNVAASLHDTVNSIQTGGLNRAGTEGAPMFSGTTAATIDLAGGFGWKDVSAAAKPPGWTVADPPSPSLGAGNALAASLRGSDPLGPDTGYSSLIGDLGRASASAKQQQTTQGVITASVDTLKSTASGVSYDEEVSNMLTYQMAFQASSRVLTTLDEMLDTLINRTGMVGR